MPNHATTQTSRRRFLLAASAGVAVSGAAVHRLTADSSAAKGRVAIVGAGAAGLSIAARLRRALPLARITILDPSPVHYYQPGFTLLAAGVFSESELSRPQASFIPSGVNLVAESVASIDPNHGLIRTASNRHFNYDFLVIAPGLEMHFHAIEGISRARLGEGNVHSIYDRASAAKCRDAIRRLAVTGGRALFTDTWTKVKCGGAPKKIHMMAEDYCRRQGARDRVDFQFYSAAARMFEIDPFRQRLEAIYQERALPIAFHHRIQSVDVRQRRVTFELRAPGSAAAPQVLTRDYDFLHIVPPMSAPRFVVESGLTADPVTGQALDWVPTDPATLRHARYGNIFVAGDVAGIPTSKTAAAVRGQAPVVAANLVAAMEGRRPEARYDGYTACPFVTNYGKVLMAEFDYTRQPRPTLPGVDPAREHRAGWIAKRYLLKPLYFDFMLRGLA